MFQYLTVRTKRLYVQALAALATNSYFLAPYLKYLPCPSLNCYACPLAVFACPIGSLQHFVIIGLFPFLLLGLLALVGSVVGRWSCGYICPFGLFQDLLAKARRRKLSLPGWMTYGRYVSLAVVTLAIPAVFNEPWFCKLCPAGTLEAGIPIVGAALFKVKVLGHYSQFLGMVGWMFHLKLALLALTVLAAVYVKRPFCRILCPLGAIFGLFNKVSILQLSVDRGCDPSRADCRKVCPVDIDIRKDPSSPDCVRCLQCLSCPGVSSSFTKGKP